MDYYGCEPGMDDEFYPPVAKRMLNLPVRKWPWFLKNQSPASWTDRVCYYATMDEYFQTDEFMNQLKEGFKGKKNLIKSLIEHGSRNIAFYESYFFDWWVEQMSEEDLKGMLKRVAYGDAFPAVE